jgi:hypothetical protein
VISVTVDWRGAKAGIAMLERYAKKAIPHATRNYVNSAAFAAQKEWKGQIKRTFTTRNQYTERSIRVEKAQGLNVRTMSARVGSVAEYMGTQEDGGTVKGKSGRKPIPGPVAAGMAPGANRTRLVRRSNWLGRLQAPSVNATGSRKQRNAAALRVARAQGKKVALLERPSGGKGLFQISGGKRKIKTRLLWDLSRSSVRVEPAPTLQRTLKRISPRLPMMAKVAVVEQMKRNRLFGY